MVLLPSEKSCPSFASQIEKAFAGVGQDDDHASSIESIATPSSSIIDAPSQSQDSRPDIQRAFYPLADVSPDTASDTQGIITPTSSTVDTQNQLQNSTSSIRRLPSRSNSVASAANSTTLGVATPTSTTDAESQIQNSSTGTRGTFDPSMVGPSVESFKALPPLDIGARLSIEFDVAGFAGPNSSCFGPKEAWPSNHVADGPELHLKDTANLIEDSDLPLRKSSNPAPENASSLAVSRCEQQAVVDTFYPLQTLTSDFEPLQQEAEMHQSLHDIKHVLRLYDDSEASILNQAEVAVDPEDMHIALAEFEGAGALAIKTLGLAGDEKPVLEPSELRKWYDFYDGERQLTRMRCVIGRPRALFLGAVFHIHIHHRILHPQERTSCNHRCGASLSTSSVYKRLFQGGLRVEAISDLVRTKLKQHQRGEKQSSRDGYGCRRTGFDGIAPRFPSRTRQRRILNQNTSQSRAYTSILASARGEYLQDIFNATELLIHVTKGEDVLVPLLRLPARACPSVDDLKAKTLEHWGTHYLRSVGARYLSEIIVKVMLPVGPTTIEIDEQWPQALRYAEWGDNGERRPEIFVFLDVDGGVGN